MADSAPYAGSCGYFYATGEGVPSADGAAVVAVEREVIALLAAGHIWLTRRMDYEVW
jgi:hypothetical protein